MHPRDVFENPENYIDFLTSKDFEGQYFDHKEIVNPYNSNKVRETKESICKCISAFANRNHDGGLVVLGINDKTQAITGLDHLTEEQLNSVLNIDLRNYVSETKSFQIQDKTIYLLYIHYTSNAICETNKANPEAWKRVGKQSLPLSEADKQQILRDKRVLDWEGLILDAEYHEEDVDEKVAESFKRGYLTKSDYDLGITKILKQLGAIREQKGILYWTNAGILFFDKSPQRMIAAASIRFLRHEFFLHEKPHLSETSFDRTFSYASLPTLLEKVRYFCKEGALFRTFFIRHPEGHLQEIPQFPTKAVEEAIINAMVHRDYAIKTEIWCRLYKDAFVVENAGRILQTDKSLPNEFTLEEIELTPLSRNRNLMEWIKLLKDDKGDPFVRGISEGTRNMKKEMQKMYFPYPKYNTNGTTRLTLTSVATAEELELKAEKTKEKKVLQLTYNLALDKAPNFEKANKLYLEMVAGEIPLNEISYSTLINKAQTFDQAKFFFDQMSEKKLTLDEISYSTLINKAQTFDQAKFFFDQMSEKKLTPNEISYSTLINKAQNYDQAKPYYESFLKLFPLKKGNFKTEKSYNFLFTALFKKVRHKEHFAFLQSEIYRLGLKLNEYAQSFYESLQKKYS